MKHEHSLSTKVEPPKTPEVTRLVRFKPEQIVGVLAFTAIVILALFGVFGTGQRIVQAEGDLVSIVVQHPTKLRYKTINPFDIRVVNRTSQPIEKLTVIIGLGYIEDFSQPQFDPAPKTITNEGYEFELTDLEPGVPQYIRGNIQAEQYGWAEGAVSVRISEGQDTAVQLATMLFP